LKKFLAVCFSLSILSSPVLAWGGGDCPFSKKGSGSGSNQETSTERLEKSDSSNKE
tara:strand:+ start:179 stop:346 length:168 start_codon:yes stop_codon:yes gene_type:complete